MKELPSGIIGPVTKIIDKVVPDKDVSLSLKFSHRQILTQGF